MLRRAWQAAAHRRSLTRRAIAHEPLGGADVTDVVECEHEPESGRSEVPAAKGQRAVDTPVVRVHDIRLDLANNPPQLADAEGIRNGRVMRSASLVHTWHAHCRCRKNVKADTACEHFVVRCRRRALSSYSHTVATGR